MTAPVNPGDVGRANIVNGALLLLGSKPLALLDNGLANRAGVESDSLQTFDRIDQSFDTVVREELSLNWRFASSVVDLPNSTVQSGMVSGWTIYPIDGVRTILITRVFSRAGLDDMPFRQDSDGLHTLPGGVSMQATIVPPVSKWPELFRRLIEQALAVRYSRMYDSDNFQMHVLNYDAAKSKAVNADFALAYPAPLLNTNYLERSRHENRFGSGLPRGRGESHPGESLLSLQCRQCAALNRRETKLDGVRIRISLDQCQAVGVPVESDPRDYDFAAPYPYGYDRTRDDPDY